MKNKIRFLVVFTSCSLFVIACLLFVNCGGQDKFSESIKQCIEDDLRGTWERDVASFWPEGQTVITEKGKLVLRHETIIITGPMAHLQNFTRNTVLEAYTEDNNLYIKDRGVWQRPISFIFWESGDLYLPTKMVTLQGSGNIDETFKLISNLY